jgi:hypothetical protein
VAIQQLPLQMGPDAQVRNKTNKNYFHYGNNIEKTGSKRSEIAGKAS